MIDKLNFYTTNFKIKDNNKLNQHSIQYSESNRWIKTKKNYKFNLQDYEFQFNINIKHNELFINLTPSKFYKKVNFPLLNNHKKLHSILKDVQKGCKEIGILFEYNNLSICALDIAKDISIDFPYSSYSKILNNLDGKRLFSNKHQDSWYFGNESRGFIFYNKTVQLKNNFNFDINKNIMRVELRLKSKRVVERDTGIFSALELFENDIIDRLNLVFENLLKDLIFNDYCEDDKRYTSFLDILKSYLNHYNSGGINKFLYDFAIYYLTKNVGKIDIFLDIIKSCDLKASTITYHKKKMFGSIKTGKFNFGKSPTSLYQELVGKLIKGKE